MLQDSARKRVIQQQEFLLANREKLVIDGDTHVTDIAAMHSTLKARYEADLNYYHGRPISAEDLIDEMDLAGVNMALIWQNPAATVYTNHPETDLRSLIQCQPVYL
ncbi:MAG: hypothetical protein HC905_19285 [Bacteroidales bacterium]|nr:hypothetical protein [Bacteroidales bacterium]